MEGYILLHRQMLEWEYADEPNVLATWVHLLLRAQHKDVRWRGMELRRGQVVIGMADFAQKVGISYQQLRSILKKLKINEQIDMKSTNKFTIVTICNYDSYQVKAETIQRTNNEQTNNQITNNQRTNNEQITKNNNENTENNIKKISLREIKEKPKAENAAKNGDEVQPPSSAAERGKPDGKASGTVAEKTEVQKHIEAIRQERQEPDRSRYLRMLVIDGEWLAHCQLENDMLGVDLKPYMLAFWHMQTDDKRWRGYEDFQKHFCYWLKFADNVEVKEISRKYVEAKKKAEEAEMRRQEQEAADAEWEEHKKRVIAMPEELVAKYGLSVNTEH